MSRFIMQIPFRTLWCLIIFRKSVEKIRIWLKSDKNSGYFKWRPTHMYDNILLKIFSERETFQTTIVWRIKTQILRSMTFLRKSCRLWGNVEKYGTAGNSTNGQIIGRMRIACWINKARIQTHTNNNFYCCTVHSDIWRVHSPTNALFYFKKHIQIYIKIHINIAPTRFGLRPSSPCTEPG